MPERIICKIRKELKNRIDKKTKATAHHFFKEDVKFYGVKTNIVNLIAKDNFESIKSLEKEQIFSLCEELLISDYSEEAWIAFDWSSRLLKKYEQSDFLIFEKWLVKYVNNWAKCDTLCNHTIGSFIEMYPEYIDRLKTWARSDNRWVRRGSAVTLILPGRKGKFLSDIFEIADILLLDSDDLVQKGYGWALKEASKSHQGEVFDYIMINRTKMPRTALRYAIEKMPDHLRKLAMQK